MSARIILTPFQTWKVSLQPNSEISKTYRSTRIWRIFDSFFWKMRPSSTEILFNWGNNVRIEFGTLETQAIDINDDFLSLFHITSLPLPSAPLPILLFPSESSSTFVKSEQSIHTMTFFNRLSITFHRLPFPSISFHLLESNEISVKTEEGRERGGGH